MGKSKNTAAPVVAGLDQEVEKTPAEPTEPVVAEQPQDIVQVISGMLNDLKEDFDAKFETISDRIDDIEELAKKKTSSKQDVIITGSTEKTKVPTSTGHVPGDIRQLVDNYISPEALVEIQEDPGLPRFTVHVTIPPAMSKSEVQPDVRSKMVRFSEGAPKVEEWLVKVRQNIIGTLNKEGKALTSIETETE